MKEKTSVIFTGHGSPMNAVGENRARKGWIEMGKRLGKPKAIVALSAHWATRGTYVLRVKKSRQIYDMYGFPDELYQIQYAPKGSPELADRVLGLLDGTAKPANDWGIDHGVWSVLCNMYPDADIPVVIVSTDVTASPEEEYEIGKRLRPLRDEGVLILASGNVVHNLRRVNFDQTDGAKWADDFDTAIRNAITAGDFTVPVHFETIPNAKLAVPTADHYYPLLGALGAADPDTDAVEVWNEYRELGSMSMTSYLFHA